MGTAAAATSRSSVLSSRVCGMHRAAMGVVAAAALKRLRPEQRLAAAAAVPSMSDDASWSFAKKTALPCVESSRAACEPLTEHAQPARHTRLSDATPP